MLHHRAEAEPTRVCGKACLFPLFLIRVQAREVFKAGTDLGVKGFEASVWELGGTHLIE